MSLSPIGWIALSIGVISVAFYIQIILLIISRRNHSRFRGFFFKLFVVEGILNVFCYITVTVFVRLRKVRALPFLDAFLSTHSEGFTPSFVIALLGSVRIALCIGIIAFALNRFIVFFLPTTHNRVFKNWHLFVIVIIQLLTLLPQLYLNYGLGSYKYTIIGPNSAIFIPTAKLYKLTSLIGLICLCATVVCSSVLYISIFIKLKIQANIEKNMMQNKRNSFEKRVLISCLLPFTALILSSILDGTTTITNNTNNSTFLAIYNELWSFLTDMLCLSHPFSLVLTCRNVREDLINKILHKQQWDLVTKAHSMTAWNTAVKRKSVQS